MSYGLISALFLQLNEKNAKTMLAMIPPMIAFVFLGMRYVTVGIRVRSERLIEAIHRVAEGDLSVELDTKNAQEYTQVYREFNAMVRELSHTKQEMESFVNEFAHEFKTPIAAINGFAEILCEDSSLTDEEEKEYLNVISEQSKRLLRLSQNALLLSKVEALEIVTDKESYDLGEQVRKCAILLLPQIEEKQIVLDMEEDLSLPFTGNREMLEHVWINLLGNAIKFTKVGGIISITGFEYGGEIHVRIRDTGIGMSDETQEHIFDKYYQNDTTGATKGNGIGLAIVKRITELSGGRVLVESRLNEGSCFEVILPKT
ncbi:MAG: HAMP domain-containing histidine kinase [Lachnospiraceae bacterium]|nr:HAMP domain-containing histidine kinase [Lachnospiraceae bacterium]